MLLKVGRSHYVKVTGNVSSVVCGKCSRSMETMIILRSKVNDGVHYFVASLLSTLDYLVYHSGLGLVLI